MSWSITLVPADKTVPRKDGPSRENSILYRDMANRGMFALKITIRSLEVKPNNV